MRRAEISLVIGLGLVVLAGCSGTSPRFGGDVDELQPGVDESDYYVEDYEPSNQEIEHLMRESEERVREDLGLGSWSCVLSPTYNDDWHDDVVCSNGTESHRPYLREWDDFVEEWEILESAGEYGAQLNAGG